jgi:hypothetical protein
LWTGINLTDAREIWTREQATIAPVTVEGWTAAVLREDLDVLAQATFERPLVRLLPYFDSYLLGHKEREHLVSLQHRPKVYRPQGWIAPVVLVDGRASAVWAQTRQGNHLNVLELIKQGQDVHHFSSLTGSPQASSQSIQAWFASIMA